MADVAIPWPRRRRLRDLAAPADTTPPEVTRVSVDQTIDRLQVLTSRLTAEVERFEQSEGGRQ